jgi:hypothetical protein
MGLLSLGQLLKLDPRPSGTTFEVIALTISVARPGLIGFHSSFHKYTG